MAKTQEVDSWGSLTLNMLKTAVPTMFNFFFLLVNEQVNQIVLGQVGTAAQQAGTGLGNMMQNLCGLCYAFGLLGGLDTLVSQANGAGRNDLVINYFQRARLISSLQMIWILPIMFFTEPILTALGQDPEVAANAAQYNMRAGPGIFCIIQFQAASKFQTNRQNADPPTKISMLSSCFHVGWVFLFVGHWKMGNAGIGWCNLITWTTQWLLLDVYQACTAKKEGFEIKELLTIQARAFTGWGEYMKAALPAMIQVCSEWMFWELTSLVMGFLGPVQLAAHTDAVLCNALFSMPAVGMQFASASLVGNKLGENKGQDARRTCILAIGLLFTVCLLMAIGIVSYKEKVAAIYTSVAEVSDVMQVLLVIISGMLLCGTLQNAMGGMLRGMGKTSIPSKAYVGIYWCYVAPIGFGLAFYWHQGVIGFWLAFLSGQFLVMLLFITVLAITDFDTLAEEISTRMLNEGLGGDGKDAPLLKQVSPSTSPTQGRRPSLGVAGVWAVPE